MTLLLHVGDLGVKCLIVLLHFVHFTLILIFLISIIIPSLLHFSELHFCASHVIAELLYLLLMCFVVLELKNGFLMLFDGQTPTMEFLSQSLIFILESLILTFEAFDSLHNF